MMHRHSFRRKLLIRILLFSSLLVFLSETVLYFGLNRFHNRNLNELQNRIIGEYVRNSELVLHQAERLILSQGMLEEFQVVGSTFFDLKEDYDRFRKITATLGTLSGGVNATYIHSTYLYHHDSGSVISAEGKIEHALFGDRQYINSILRNSGHYAWSAPRRYGTSQEKVISYSIPVPVTDIGSTTIMVINIRESLLNDIYLGPLFILDADNTLLYANSALAPAVSDIAAIGDLEKIQVDGSEYLVTRKRSDYLGWDFITLSNVAEILKTQRLVIGFVVGLTLASFAVIGITSVLLARATYAPIKHLRTLVSDPSQDEPELDELEALEKRILNMARDNRQYRERLELTDRMMSEKAQWSLMTGSINDQDRKWIADELLTYEGSLRVWMIEHPVPILAKSEIQLHFHDIIQAFFGEKAVLQLFETTRSLIAVDLPRDEGAERTSRSLFRRLQTEFPMQFCIIVGKQVARICDLGDSYHDAERLANLKRVLPGVPIIFEKDSSDTDTAYAAVDAESEAFRRQLKNGSYDEARKAVDALLSPDADSTAYAYRELKLNQAASLLIAHILRELEIPEAIDYSTTPWEDFKNLESSAEIRDWFDRHIRKIQEIITLRKDNAHHRIMEEAVEYIENHYQEALTAQIMADRINISPNYFSTLFKREIGRNFLPYLQSIRMEKAKDLLANSYLSVSQIAADTGFGHKQNIIRTFKKEIGMPPGEYRSRFRKS